MPLSQTLATSAPESTTLSDWSAAVREGLSGLGKPATAMQERRMVKTLERLDAAAKVALAGTTSPAPEAAAPDFHSVLAQLSDA